MAAKTGDFCLTRREVTVSLRNRLPIQAMTRGGDDRFALPNAHLSCQESEMRKCTARRVCAAQAPGAVGVLLIAFFAIALAPSSSHAQVVLGNWESGAPEGWIDWSGGQTPIAPPRFGFNGIGATLGTMAVQFNHPNGGFTQWAALKLQQGSNGVDEWRDDFLASAKLAVDITLVRDEMVTSPSNDFANIGFVVNADGYGFTSQGNPESVTPFIGFNGGNAFNPQNLVGTQTSTWTWDIFDTHDGVAPDIVANPNYIEIIFDTFSNGGVVYHIDNVRLIIPEPASVGLGGVGLAVMALRRRGLR
jgi:hypothetical protein